MKISKEVKIGIYVVITLILLYLLVNFLKGRNIFGKEKTYYAVFNDVQGLQQASTVYFKGLRIGKIETIKFRDDEGNFVVKMKLKSDYNIPEGSKAIIYSTDLLGSKALKINLSNNKTYLESGGWMESGIESDLTSVVANELIPIKEKAETLLNNLNVTFDNLNKSLDSTRMQTMLANATQITENLKKSSNSLNNLLSNGKGSISNVIKNAESITTSLNANMDNITKMVSNLTTTSEKIKQVDVDKLSQNVNTLLNKINKGDGTLGLLLNNDSLYNNLTHTLQSLDLLLEDFKAHPKRYINVSVFGRKSKD